MTLNEIESMARYLAREARASEPGIFKIYWFPNTEEVRLIELIEDVPATPSDDPRVYPFYFPANNAAGLPAPSGVALIRPDEFGKLELPPEWGRWELAMEISGD